MEGTARSNSPPPPSCPHFLKFASPVCIILALLSQGLFPTFLTRVLFVQFVILLYAISLFTMGNRSYYEMENLLRSKLFSEKDTKCKTYETGCALW
jgi:hypothetical protein